MPEDRQLQKRRQRMLKTAYLTAVLAGCTISTASYAQVTKQWDGSSGSDYNTNNNWTTSGEPGVNDQAVFGDLSTAQNVVEITDDNDIDRIQFSGGANAQSFNLRINNNDDLDIQGTNTFSGSTLGVDNASGYTQSFSLMNSSSRLRFYNNSTITNTGTGSQVRINNLAGGNVYFNDSSSAGDANVSIVNEGNSDTYFEDNSNAGYATITNNDGGITHFHDDSDAYSANIINNAGGRTQFEDSSSADRGMDDQRTVITNQGTSQSFGDRGQTTFEDDSTAGEARIINNAYGRTVFEDDSTAGYARIRNNTDGRTYFEDDSNAGNARIVNDGGETRFYGDSSAANAIIINRDGGSTLFDNDGNWWNTTTAGNATIINQDGGTTIFDNWGDVNTATVINRTGGELIIDDAVSIGHVRGSGNVLLNNRLTLDSTGTENPYRTDTISGVISGNGGLTKEGENRVRLTGNNTYLGDTYVNNGVLDLRGSITSDTEINSGGELRGNGVIYGDLTNDGGDLRPGTGNGWRRYDDLGVTGNFISTNPDSVFVSNVHRDDYGRSSNVLYVDGNAQLGGRVQVRVAQGPDTIYLVNNRFTLVETAGNTLTGTFSGVTTETDLDNPSDIPDYLSLTEDAANGINGGLSYEPYRASIHLQRNTLNDLIDGVNLTPNQRAAYNSLNVADFSDIDGDQEDVINEFIYNSSYVGSAKAASLVSGDALTAYPVAAQGAASRFNQRILSQAANGTKQNEDYAAANRTSRLVYNGTRFSSLLAQSDAAAKSEAQAVAAAKRSSIWATIARAKEDTDSDGNGPGFDVRATEYQVGYNRNISDRTVAGISIGKSDADINIDDRSAKGDLDTTSIAAFVRHDNDDLYFSGLLSYSRHNIDSTRATGLFTTANGDYDARTIALWGEVGKKLERGSLKIEPHISLKLSNTKQDSFSESGFGGLDVNSEKYNTRRLGLGVRVVSNSATSRFRPYGFVGYEREFGDEQAELTSSAAGLSSFNVKGSTLGKNIWALRLGTDARINDRFSVVGEIGASWRKNQDSRYIYGGVKYGW